MRCSLHFWGVDSLPNRLASLANLSVSQKATLLLSAVLLILSFVAILYFVCLSVISFVTPRFAHAWNVSFLLCSTALGGWMVFYAGLLRIGGGLMYFRRNVVLFWILIFTVLASATVRFSGPQRYFAIFGLALSLIGFHVAVPRFLSAIWRIHRK